MFVAWKDRFNKVNEEVTKQDVIDVVAGYSSQDKIYYKGIWFHYADVSKNAARKYIDDAIRDWGHLPDQD